MPGPVWRCLYGKKTDWIRIWLRLKGLRYSLNPFASRTTQCFGDTVPGGLWQRVVVGLSRLDGGNRSAGTHGWITARAGLGRSRLRVHQRPIHTCPVDVIRRVQPGSEVNQLPHGF